MPFLARQLLPHVHSKIVPLPNRYPLVPQQIIGRRDMEIEIWQHEGQKVVLRREPVLPPARLEHNLGILFPVDAVLGHRLQVVDRLLDARLQLLKGGFFVGHRRGFGAGNAGGAVFGHVADPLDLEGESGHVVDQADFEELSVGDLPVGRIWLAMTRCECASGVERCIWTVKARDCVLRRRPKTIEG